MKSGDTLWNELCVHYYKGVEGVKEMQHIWNSLEGKIDSESFKSVKACLKIEYEDGVNGGMGVYYISKHSQNCRFRQDY